MKALARAVTRADGYSLILAVGRDAEPPDSLFAELETVTAGHFQKVQLENASDPLAAIQLSTTAEPRALLLVGIVRLFQGRLGREFLTALNLQRSDWARQIACPVVLWVPDRYLGELLRGAPDFFDTRSDTLFFESEFKPESVRPSRQFSNWIRFGARPHGELRARIAELESRLSTIGPAKNLGHLRLPWLLELARLQLAGGDAKAALEILDHGVDPKLRKAMDPTLRKQDRLLRVAALIETNAFGEELRSLLSQEEGEVNPVLRLEALRAEFEAAPTVPAGLEALQRVPSWIEDLQDPRAEAVAWAWLAEIAEWLGEKEKALEIWSGQVLSRLSEAGESDSLLPVIWAMFALQIELGIPTREAT